MIIHRCYVNIEGYNKTLSGRRKIWWTDGIKTYCCSANPTLLIWEKANKYNSYNPYSGYVNFYDVEFINK